VVSIKLRKPKTGLNEHRMRWGEALSENALTPKIIRERSLYSLCYWFPQKFLSELTATIIC
jgi:hypothetical protein